MVEAAKEFVCILVNCTNKSEESKKLQWLHGSRSYPTIFFLDPRGGFIDLMHFKTPDETLAKLARLGEADYLRWKRPEPVEFSIQQETDVRLRGFHLQVKSVTLRQVHFRLAGKPWRRVVVIDEEGRTATVRKEPAKMSISYLTKGFGTPAKIRVYPEPPAPPKKLATR